MKPIVQISLDLTNIEEALETAAMAIRAGVDWLEAGTPLILAEGLQGVLKLREAFPEVPIVADLKTYGRLDAVVNNAAMVVSSNIHTTDLVFFRSVMEVNMIAPFALRNGATGTQRCLSQQKNEAVLALTLRRQNENKTCFLPYR